MSVLPHKLLDGHQRETTIELLIRPSPTTLYPGERSLMCWTLPPWQRPEVWGVERKKAYVEGIFLGLGTGFYVATEEDWFTDGQRKPMSGWLLDGQQRICAIRDFLAGDLEIFEGVSWRDLSEVDQRRRFLHLNFPYVQIAATQDESRLKELYLRLCFGGVAHTDQDRALVQQTELPVGVQVVRERPG